MQIILFTPTIYFNLNYYKYTDYKIDFCNNNYKNNFNVAITDIGIEKIIYIAVLYINNKQ